MKFLAVFSAILAVALASPATWSISELSEAIQNPNTDPALVPILEQALNELMLATFLGSPQTTTTVSTVVQDFSAWTLHELSEAIQDPATDPTLLVYLEHALNTMMSNIMAGNQQDYIIVATPVGLLPVEQTVVPVVPVEAPVVPAEVAAPVVPAETTASSPLVQIIVNVKSQEAAAPVPVAPVEVPESVVLPQPVAPIVVPQPVAPIVVPEPVVLPEPAVPVVVPEPVVLPEPVLPVVVPEPVVVAPVIVPNPVDIIAINPPEVNPIDIVAITAPEVNPVDILSPVPVVQPVVVGGVVGPIV